MNYNFKEFNKEIENIQQWLKRELSSIRTGQATPAILDNIKVDSHGSKMIISHVASITVENARTLRVTPWDKEMIKKIEKAMTVADLGISVIVDDLGLRIIFPELTTQRRVMLKKLLGEKLEKARVSIRSEREKIWNDIQAQEKDGNMSEDEKFTAKDDLQKLVDESIKKLDERFKKKEIEISV